MLEKTTSPTGAPEEVVRFLRSVRLPLHDEKAAQVELDRLFLNRGISFAREHKLSPGNVIDFFFPESGLGLEIKLKAPKRAIYRQCQRYCDHEDISGIILASATFMGLPQEIKGKPVWFVSLSHNWAFGG